MIVDSLEEIVQLYVDIGNVVIVVIELVGTIQSDDVLVERTDDDELDEVKCIRYLVATHTLELLDVMLQSFVVETEQTDWLETIEEITAFVLVDNLDEVEVIEYVIEETEVTDELEMNEMVEMDEDEDLDDIEVEIDEAVDTEIVQILEELEVEDEIVIGEMLETDEGLERHMMVEAIHIDILDMVEMVETHIGEMVEMVEMIIDDATLEFTLENDDVRCLVMLDNEVNDTKVLLVQISLEQIEEVFLVELIDWLCLEKYSIITVL